jgi:hypothetical protein
VIQASLISSRSQKKNSSSNKKKLKMTRMRFFYFFLLVWETPSTLKAETLLRLVRTLAGFTQTLTCGARTLQPSHNLTFWSYATLGTVPKKPDWISNLSFKHVACSSRPFRALTEFGGGHLAFLSLFERRRNGSCGATSAVNEFRFVVTKRLTKWISVSFY